MITSSDIVYRLSVSAAVGDTTGGTPATSLGDQVSTTVITDASLQNLFDNVAGSEAGSGDTEYRCIFVLNNHATLTLLGAKVLVQSETSGGGNITIALDNIAVSAKGSSSAQAAAIVDENSAPSGVGSFGAGPLTIGDIAPGQVKAIWIKRVVPSSTTAIDSDGVVIRVEGDTAA